MTDMEAILDITEEKGEVSFAANGAKLGFPLLFDEAWNTQKNFWKSGMEAFTRRLCYQRTRSLCSSSRCRYQWHVSH